MQIRTRFPPENGGHLHIGHIKAAYSNYKYAKDHNGEMIIRMDDTNPKNAKQEYANLILEDLSKLNLINKDTLITYTSDHFDLLLEYAKKLLQSGDAYIDDEPKKTVKKNRKYMIESTSRFNPIELNLELWSQMINGNDTLTFRAKIDMKHKQACMRDPILYRSCDVPHYRSGTKYKIYPSYDLSCPILDSIEGITNTFRTSEYSDRNDLYFWVLEKLNLRKPELQLFSSLSFENTLLSKRKIRWLIENNYVMGWDDPRLCTIGGLLRRGMTIQGILEYIEHYYLSNITSKHGTYSLMITINNVILDKIASRYTAINKENAHVLTFDPPIDQTIKSIPIHPKNLELGTRNLSISNNVYLENEDVKLLKEGDEITLLNLGNVIIKTINDGMIIGQPNFNGNFKTTKYKLSWLSTDDAIELTINEFSHILKTPKLVYKQDTDEIDHTCINTDSKRTMKCYGDTALKYLSSGTHVQLLRRGFHVIDINNENQLELNRLPDTTKKINHLSAYYENQ